MRRLTGLLVFMLVTGCQPIAMTNAPAVQTDAGRQCVQGCQGLYNQCMVGASQAVSAGATRQVTLINGCRENLGGCYGTCPP
jgi:hypothetical protein